MTNSNRLLAAAAAIAFALALPAPALADTWIRNVRGVQANADGTLQRFGGLRIGEDGRVAALTDAKTKIVPRPTDRVVDGEGRMLLPGLIDAHGHFFNLGFGLLQLDLTGSRSLSELQTRLRAYAAANPGTGWIEGRGWNQEEWPGKAFPTSADLDAVVRDRPVWLVRVDGHAAVGNSAALKAAGITAATAAPDGGRIDRGLFVDNARALVERHIPPPTAAMASQALAAAQQAMLEVGLTAMADMGTSAKEWRLLHDSAARGGLKVRVMSYAGGVEALRDLRVTRPTPWLFGDRLRLGGVKLYADGALGSRGAWLKADYADAASHGLPLLTPAQLREKVAIAKAGGFQVAVHAIGDAANATVLDAYEAFGSAQGDKRWRIEHAQIVDPADLPRFARGHIIASMQPSHETSDWRMAQARMGEARLQGAYAWRTLLNSGAQLALGSDFPVESPNPFPGLSAAVYRQDSEGAPPGGWHPAERLSFGEALRGFTRDAAYAGFAEGRFGTLTPGQWADFVLVDRDVTTADWKALRETKVLQTWVAGKLAWVRGAAVPARAK